MITVLSITGLFRTLLILIGAFVLIRFLGQLMNAKRNMETERRANEEDRLFAKEKLQKQKKMGRTEVIKDTTVNGDVQDVDFVEIED